MLDTESKRRKEQQKQKVKKRYNVTIDPENYMFIPAKKQTDYYDNDVNQRVAIYVRVSTDDVRQTTSYELQKKYYEEFVTRHPNWTLVKIYADAAVIIGLKTLRLKKCQKHAAFELFHAKTASKTKRVCLPKVALGSADALFSCPDAVTWHGQSVLHSTSTCSLTEPEGVLFCCPVWAGMEARAMNGHTEDKPKDCRYCYFWKQTEGCTYRGKTDCYYISAQKPPATVSECDGCPYGRASPCIGWCTKELMRSMGLWKGREDT